MSNNIKSLEVDFTEQIKATLITKCDGCGKTMGDGYPRGRDVMTATLKTGTDQDGYDTYKQQHYHNEACMLAGLQARAAKNDQDKLDKEAAKAGA